jgi:hypothetical protein
MTLRALTATDHRQSPRRPRPTDRTIYQVAHTTCAGGVVTQTELPPPTTYDRETGVNHLLGVIDDLARRTAYTHDSMGNSAALPGWRDGRGSGCGVPVRAGIQSGRSRKPKWPTVFLGRPSVARRDWK